MPEIVLRAFPVEDGATVVSDQAVRGFPGQTVPMYDGDDSHFVGNVVIINAWIEDGWVMLRAATESQDIPW